MATKADTPITSMLLLQCKCSFISVKILNPILGHPIANQKDLLVPAVIGLSDVIIVGPCALPAMSLYISSVPRFHLAFSEWRITLYPWACVHLVLLASYPFADSSFSSRSSSFSTKDSTMIDGDFSTNEENFSNFSLVTKNVKSRSKIAYVFKWAPFWNLISKKENNYVFQK